MSEVQMSEIDQAKAELHLARAYHAGVLLAAKHRPDDPQTQYRLHEAMQRGKGAWKAFQMATAAGQAAQIQHLVPTAFQED